MKLITAIALLSLTSSAFALNLVTTTIKVSVRGELRPATFTFDEVSDESINYPGFSKTMLSFYKPRLSIDGKSIPLGSDMDRRNEINKKICEKIYKDNNLGKVKSQHGTNYSELGSVFNSRAVIQAPGEATAKVVDKKQSQYYIELLNCNYVY